MIAISDPNVFRDNVKLQLGEILDNAKNGDNLERGIYNKVLEEAETRNIIKKWENSYFVLLYVNRFRSVYNNIQNKLKCQEFVCFRLFFDFLVIGKFKRNQLQLNCILTSKHYLMSVYKCLWKLHFN